jgi:flagellar basal-body rod protein FlgC
MSLFGAIDVAGTGVNTQQIWLDTIASNVANANDTAAPGQPLYQEQEVLVQPIPASPSSFVPNATGYALGEGVAVKAIVTPKPNGELAYDPGSVLANAQGYVNTPGISLSSQLGNLVTAQYGYQANVSVINHAKAAYEAILGIGA